MGGAGLHGAPAQGQPPAQPARRPGSTVTLYSTSFPCPQYKTLNMKNSTVIDGVQPDDQTWWAANLAYAEGWIAGIETDTITTCSEYRALLGITDLPLVYQFKITRSAVKEQMRAGRSDAYAFISRGTRAPGDD